MRLRLTCEHYFFEKLRDYLKLSLSRMQLIDLAVHKYFGGHNAHDRLKVLSTIAESCVVRFNASPHRFEGRGAIDLHTQDVLRNFSNVKFFDFNNVVDVDAQTLVSRFTVHLTNAAGEVTAMKNCNFFKVNDQGLFGDILIFNSAPLGKGFRDGNTA